MVNAALKTRYTPEDLLTLPDGKRYELVGGGLVEKNMGAYSCVVAGIVIGRIHAWLASNPLGYVAPELSLQCFAFDPQLVRRPDVAFISASKLQNGVPLHGHFRHAPDLAIEIVSPGDAAGEIDEKVSDYLRAGVRLVWIVHPQNKTVIIYRLNGTIIGVTESGALDGEDVLPGFTLKATELFKTPVATK